MPELFFKNLLSPDAIPVSSSNDLNHPTVSDLVLKDRDRSSGVLKPAAVLIPLVRRLQGISVLLIQRTKHLQNHAGQISFPGGKTEAADNGPVATALREAREEIGLSPEFVQVMGLLDDYETVTGYRITPVVSMVSEGFTISLDPYEVLEAFEVPLDFILDPQNHQVCSRAIDGIEHTFYAIEYRERYIWGATAGILLNLYTQIEVEGRV